MTPGRFVDFGKGSGRFDQHVAVIRRFMQWQVDDPLITDDELSVAVQGESGNDLTGVVHLATDQHHPFSAADRLGK